MRKLYENYASSTIMGINSGSHSLFMNRLRDTGRDRFIIEQQYPTSRIQISFRIVYCLKDNGLAGSADEKSMAGTVPVFFQKMPERIAAFVLV